MRPIRALAVIVSSVALLQSCATSDGNSAYNHDCPSGMLAQIEVIDVSASGRNSIVLGERLDAVQVAAEKVADCDGKLTVIAWAGSSSASKVLYTGPIPIAGATEIGRDRKIPEAVDKVMTDIRASMSAALGEISPERSDLAGAFYLISDVVESIKTFGSTVDAEIFTDAISTGGNSNINDPALTEDRVHAMVAEENLPSLDGMAVAVRGVGRVAGIAPPPQDFIQLVQEYASGMCIKTGAECSVFTTVVSS